MQQDIENVKQKIDQLTPEEKQIIVKSIPVQTYPIQYIQPAPVYYGPSLSRIYTLPLTLAALSLLPRRPLYRPRYRRRFFGRRGRRRRF